MTPRIDQRSNLRIPAFLLISAISFSTIAGTPDGPYIVFADLSATGKAPTAIKAYMDSDRKGMFCGDIARSPLVMLKKRPEGMADQYLDEALVKKDPRARKKIQDLLVAYRLDSIITQGLDGVVVYVDQPQPRMLGLGVIGTIRTAPVQFRHREAIVEAFCNAIPDIQRN